MPSAQESPEGGEEDVLHYEETEDDAVSPMDLSELLKEGTKESHDRAENTQFVKDFLKGRIKKELFKLATVALYFTYSALEEEMDHNKDNPLFAPLYFPVELHRREALAKDLKYFYGEDWKEKIQCSEATQQYVDRIHHVGQHEPELLVAHAYTRYMGDLSGGQVLKKVAQRALKLPSTEEGIQFYVFDNISNAQQFKQLYRARMNALDLDKNTKERIVEEANKAFRFNMQVFDELLLDADFSVNAGSWMWLSCSAFFQQFFHCYCPVGFGRRTDPSGDYVKRYLPKLKGFPSRYIYEPWNAPESVQKAAKCIIGVDYPKPMVNHAETSRLNIERMKQIYQQLSRYRGLCLLASVPSCVEDLSGPVTDSASGQGCSTSTAVRLSQADQASPKRKHEGAEEPCPEELYKRAKVTDLPASEISGKSL